MGVNQRNGKENKSVPNLTCKYEKKCSKSLHLESQSRTDEKFAGKQDKSNSFLNDEMITKKFSRVTFIGKAIFLETAATLFFINI